MAAIGKKTPLMKLTIRHPELGVGRVYGKKPS
jgi:hypothetical protein